MKKSFSFITLVVATTTLISSLLCACTSMEEEGTSYPLRLNAEIETVSGLPENAFSEESPCHIVAYAREKACSPFYFLFEDDAYVSGEGQINLLGKYRYWPGGYCKFVAYWPADAHVDLDEVGNIISADCTLIAISEPYCHFSENPTLYFHSYNQAGF